MPGLVRTRRGIVRIGSAIASVLLLSACGTNGDNRVGIAIIEDLGESKAVRDTTFSPPDSTTDFHLTNPPPGVGLSGSLLIGRRTGYFSRSFLKFDPSDLPDSGTVIDSATVHLIAREDKPDTDPVFVMTVHRVTANWNEADASPDSIPPFLSVASDTITFDSFAKDDTASFAISLAQFWVDQPDSNFGLALVPGDGMSSFLEFGSQETLSPPRLSVAWDTVSVDFAATHDTFVLETIDGEWTPLPGFPRRLTVARGVPARSLLRFELPEAGEVPGFSDLATVNRAELVLHVDQSASEVNEFQVGVQRVLQEPWAADSTVASSLLLGTTAVDAASDSVVFSIGMHVQELLRSGNHGFQVRALDERPDLDYVRFHGRDSEDSAKVPSLRVWYTPADVGEGGP